ncbi:MAG: hypothetical protein HC937_00945 [Aquincola sp.]|nr:hypothetical protein [Aquincola sp.]
MATTLPPSIELVLKASDSGADLYAAHIALQSATEPVAGLWEASQAALSVVQAGEAVYSLAREVPYLGAGLDLVGLGFSLETARRQMAEGTGVSAATIASIVSNVAQLASAGALVTAAAAAAAGISAPVVITVAGATAALGIAASIYSTATGVREGAERTDMALRWSTRILDEMGAYGDYSWSVRDGETFELSYKQNPVMGPVLQMVHAIDPSLSLQQAVDLVGRSDLGSWLQGGKLAEASSLLLAVERVFTGQDVGPPQNLAEYNALLVTLWPSIRERAGQFLISPSHSAEIAREDFAALLSMTNGATFSLRLRDASPVSPASLALYANHRAAYEQWLSDRNLTAEQRDAGRLNFSDAYLSDRAEMLNAWARLNQQDTREEVIGQRATVYRDIARNVEIVVGNRDVTGTVPSRNLAFGGEGGDTLAGEGAQDRLYGAPATTLSAATATPTTSKAIAATTAWTAAAATTPCSAARTTTPTSSPRAAAETSSSMPMAAEASNGTAATCPKA